ncbi:MAG: hypothetical protein AAB353_11780, partial [Candidatus Hydrogenedentota bacterium]
GNGSPLKTLAILGLVIIIGVGYYFGSKELNKKDTQINDMTAKIAGLEAYQKSAVMQMERMKTEHEAELAKLKAAASTSGPAAARAKRDNPYQPGDILKSWNAFHAARRGFGPQMSDEEYAKSIAEADLNGGRGPDQKEIECFETMLGSGQGGLLGAIFEANAEETLASKDVGTAPGMLKGVENLLAFYVTLGDEGSMSFLKQFLTNSPATQLMKTKFDGHYLTFGSAAICADLAKCTGQ